MLLAWTSLVLLAVAFASPFLSVTKFGNAETYTLPGGVLRLFREGHTVIAAVLFLFSIVFPVLKLILTMVSTTRLARLSDQARRRMVRFAIVTGKYSMLDILVVAVLIVAIQVDGLASVRPGIGVSLFTGAIILSAVSGWLVDFGASVQADGTVK
ncbi:MAG: paraquat-inducible protein A [Phycisphaerales bacterium]